MYYQCFPTRGKARKDTNKSLISNTFRCIRADGQNRAEQKSKEN